MILIQNLLLWEKHWANSNSGTAYKIHDGNRKASLEQKKFIKEKLRKFGYIMDFNNLSVLVH